MPDALVFDVDGTLYSERALRKRLLPRLAWSAVRAGWNGVRLLRAVAEYRRQLERMRALPPGACGEGVQLRRTVDKTRLPEEFVASVVSRWMEQEPLSDLLACRRDGLPELLESARNKGIRLAALSDYPPQRKLCALGVESYFEIVAWSGEPAIATLKPHPRGLLEVLRRMNVPPARAWYLGDRWAVDGETARRAGCEFVHVEHDLRELVRRIG